MSTADWIRLLVLSVVWSVSFILVEVALAHAGPFTIVLGRVGFAAAALLAYCAATGVRPTLSLSLVGAFAVIGFFNNALPFTLITLGQTEITGGLAAILNATTPLFTVLVAHLWGRTEPATVPKLSGVLVGLAGVAVLMRLEAASGAGGAIWGQIAVLGAGLSYAIAAVFGKRLTGLPPEVLAAGMLTASTLMIAPLAFALETPLAPVPPMGTGVAIVALALVSTAFAYILYFRILANAGATNAMLVTFLIPANAILLGVLFLGEPLESHHLAGLALILAGLALIDGRILRRIGRAGPTS